MYYLVWINIDLSDVIIGLNNMPPLEKTISLKQLRIFAAAAQTGSFIGAASQLHLSQPAISMQMAKLAEITESELFRKIGRQLELTAAGELLLSYVQNILDQLEEAGEALDALHGMRRGTIRLAITTTARYFIPQLVKRFNDQHSDIEVQMEVVNRSQVVEYLAQGSIDIAIMGRPPKRINVQSEVFAEHPYVLIAHPQHPLAKQKGISPSDIANEIFLKREDGSGTRKLMNYFLSSNDIDSPRGHVVGGNESIKQSVMAGLGIAFMSRHTISHELASGRLVVLEVKNLPIIRTWNLLRPANKPASLATEALVEFLKAEAPAEVDAL